MEMGRRGAARHSPVSYLTAVVKVTARFLVRLRESLAINRASTKKTLSSVAATRDDRTTRTKPRQNALKRSKYHKARAKSYL